MDDGTRGIDIDELPELETAVAVHGSALRQEVGGDACIAIILALMNHP